MSVSDAPENTQRKHTVTHRRPRESPEPTRAPRMHARGFSAVARVSTFSELVWLELANKESLFLHASETPTTREDGREASRPASLLPGFTALPHAAMPPMCARHVTAKVASMGGETDPAHFVNLPWRPISTTISIPREPPKPANAPPEEEQRQKRDKLAASAQSRYEEWKTNQPPPGRPETSASIISHHFPKFREREKARELHGDWASADKVPNERERIRTAVANAEATYLQSPPTPSRAAPSRTSSSPT